jgi:hypothetical protein
MKGSKMVEMNFGDVHAITVYKSKSEGEQNEKDEHVSGGGLLCGVSWRDPRCPVERAGREGVGRLQQRG